MFNYLNTSLKNNVQDADKSLSLHVTKPTLKCQNVVQAIKDTNHATAHFKKFTDVLDSLTLDFKLVEFSASGFGDYQAKVLPLLQGTQDCATIKLD